MRVGPFAVTALDGQPTGPHVETLRSMLQVDWPWHVLLAHHRRRIQVRAAPAHRWRWAGIYVHATGTVTASTDRDIGGVVAHEVGHAVDQIVLNQADKAAIHQAWGGHPDRTWGGVLDGESAPHRDRPQEAFANWFAWRVGQRTPTSYGPHSWTAKDAQDRIEEIVMTAADKAQVFDDVDPDSAHADSILWAAGQGLVTGYDDGTFRPDQPVTRGQLATILHRQAS